MSLLPRLLVGHVMHRRLRPVSHAFAYPVFYLQLPLQELAQCARGIFSVDRLNLLSLYTRDHGARDGSPLLPWIRARLRERGLPDDGLILLQTMPRVCGYVFNPVSFWFCHDRFGVLVAVLAEVNNTFGATHSYLLHNPDGAPLADGQELRSEKRFHVSPFCEVAGVYRFRFYLGRARPRACIDYDDAHGPLLRTAISGRPEAWTAANLLRAFLRMPLLTVGVMVRIHWQALQLWRKGVPFLGARPVTRVTQPIPQQEPTK